MSEGGDGGRGSRNREEGEETERERERVREGGREGGTEGGRGSRKREEGEERARERERERGERGANGVRQRQGEREKGREVVKVVKVQKKHRLMHEAHPAPGFRKAPLARFAEAQVSCESYSQNAGSANAGRCSTHLEAAVHCPPKEAASKRLLGREWWFLTRLLPSIHGFEALPSSRLLQWLKRNGTAGYKGFGPNKETARNRTGE